MVNRGQISQLPTGLNRLKLRIGPTDFDTDARGALHADLRGRIREDWRALTFATPGTTPGKGRQWKSRFVCLYGGVWSGMPAFPTPT